ncbi:zinc-ribbon domain-containing protein [Bacillus sp. CGMCC 1.16607]|uniref:zinc-ribbon domain-containing protein n=1 Tax=Bacillus sp. CGMCC 1.16607 TaxID=3351842 RepID=UPI0036259085
MLAGIGGIGFAMFDFFTLDTWEQPKYFWMFFVGAPLIFIGFVLNMGRIQRVMLDQQKDTLKETMKVMGEGFQEGLNSVEKIDGKFCSNCGKGVRKGDKFCSHCGTSLND